MAVTLWRAIPLHRSIQQALFANLAPVVTLASGVPAWNLSHNTAGLQIDGVMRRSYAGQDFTLAITWTVPPATVGTIALSAGFRRHILGTNAFSPYSAQLGVGQQGPPAAWVPFTTSIPVAQVHTQPLFPGGLGGITAGDKFRLGIGRFSFTVGATYVLGVEMWVP